MDKRSLDGKHSSKEFTEVITRNIIAGHERDYDDWLRRSSVRYVINRFANQASLDAWENSEESLKLLEEVNKYSTYQRVTGMETWFSLPNLKTIGPPPRWKMAIVTFIAAYSISSLVSLFFSLSLYIRQTPFLANTIMTIILVTGLTYFAMPLLSRLLRRWLYPRNV